MAVPVDVRTIAIVVSTCGSCGGTLRSSTMLFESFLLSLFRTKGVSELYVYLPVTASNQRQLLAVPPMSSSNKDYGFSVGRGAFSSTIAVGRWMSVAIRTKLNGVGSDDGTYSLNF